MRHLDHAKGEPCNICDEPKGPWWFAGDPHVAFDGKVYCPHCTQILGSTMEFALARKAPHTKATCEAWAEFTGRRVATEEGLPPLFAL